MYADAKVSQFKKSNLNDDSIPIPRQNKLKYVKFH